MDGSNRALELIAAKHICIHDPTLVAEQAIRVQKVFAYGAPRSHRVEDFEIAGAEKEFPYNYDFVQQQQRTAAAKYSTGSRQLQL